MKTFNSEPSIGLSQLMQKLRRWHRLVGTDEIRLKAIGRAAAIHTMHQQNSPQPQVAYHNQ
ncbi:MAG: hypothetical protein RMK18_04950 [Armatimonadota bacterium]|nr:hypothetical protein [Armatimonadota bacterium]MCX7777151.1 hypothetical protein [Armatimonadota bacterium]MDW8025199.1 hypothetical protein [Armatimonadota bacterium]